MGVLIPIPGLFFAVSAAGSVGAKWVAGKFINSDGEELANGTWHTRVFFFVNVLLTSSDLL